MNQKNNLFLDTKKIKTFKQFEMVYEIFKDQIENWFDPDFFKIREIVDYLLTTNCNDFFTDPYKFSVILCEKSIINILETLETEIADGKQMPFEFLTFIFVWYSDKLPYSTKLVLSKASIYIDSIDFDLRVGHKFLDSNKNLFLLTYDPKNKIHHDIYYYQMYKLFRRRLEPKQYKIMFSKFVSDISNDNLFMNDNKKIINEYSKYILNISDFECLFNALNKKEKENFLENIFIEHKEFQNLRPLITYLIMKGEKDK